MAEVFAVEMGLKYSWELGHKRVVCASNCLQLVEILNGGVEVSTFWARDALERV